jgi:excisionase family DNA binding protein
MTEFLNVRETAEIVGVHENTIRNWADRGIIKAHKLPGSGYRRFAFEDVQKLIDAIRSGDVELYRRTAEQERHRQDG